MTSDAERFKLKLSDLAVSKEEMVGHMSHRLTFLETDESHFVLVICLTCGESMQTESQDFGKIIGVMTEPGPIAELKTMIDPTLISEAELSAKMLGQHLN